MKGGFLHNCNRHNRKQLMPNSLQRKVWKYNQNLIEWNEKIKLFDTRGWQQQNNVWQYSSISLSIKSHNTQWMSSSKQNKIKKKLFESCKQREQEWWGWYACTRKGCNEWVVSVCLENIHISYSLLVLFTMREMHGARMLYICYARVSAVNHRMTNYTPEIYHSDSNLFVSLFALHSTCGHNYCGGLDAVASFSHSIEFHSLHIMMVFTIKLFLMFPITLKSCPYA